MRTKPGKQMITRIVVIMLALIIAMFGVSGYRLINIMIINGEKFQNDASEQQLYDSLITAPRGDIYDRNMQTLATRPFGRKVLWIPSTTFSLVRMTRLNIIRRTIPICTKNCFAVSRNWN